MGGRDALSSLLKAHPLSRSSLAAEIGPAIAVDRLPVDVAGGASAQKPHRRRDVLRASALAGDGLVNQMMRRFRLVFGARRADQAGNHAIDGDAIGGQVMGERGRPEDVAAAVRFLCGGAARYINGQAIHSNGGAYLGS